jgi:hypothetical protein
MHRYVALKIFVASDYVHEIFSVFFFLELGTLTKLEHQNSIKTNTKTASQNWSQNTDVGLNAETNLF